MAIVYHHGYRLIGNFYVAPIKSRLIGHRSVGVGDKKPINRRSVGKHRQQKAD